MKQYSVRLMRLNRKSLLLAGVAAVIAGGMPGAAAAEDLNESSDPTIVVTAGYAKSLSDARDIKRDSIIQKDVIVAEDTQATEAAGPRIPPNRNNETSTCRTSPS